MRRCAILSALLVLAGCATANPRHASVETPAAKAARIDAANASAAQILDQQCADSMKTSRLNPIRDKVELFKPVAADVPMAILANHDYPTADEQAAIAVWSTLTDRCQRRFLAWEQKRPLPPDLTPAIARHMQGFETAEWRLDDELRAVLDQGRLTYSDYATARQAILVNGNQMIHHYYAAVLARDERAMAAVDADYQRVIMSAETYIRTADGGALPTLRPLAQAGHAAAHPE